MKNLSDILHSKASPKVWSYIQLTRLDKPIGIYLLLWPCAWALLIAGDGQPSIKVCLIFLAGVVLMRSAGCAINDFADRKVDGQVERTKTRPLAEGSLQAKDALLCAGLLVLIAFILVLQLNWQTIAWSFGAVTIAFAYPFMKRYTHLPQVVLGAAFAWSIPMAFSALQNTVPDYAWLIYLATVLWTVAYDTMYAMVDREDDIKIGVKSTAILFGELDKIIIATLQVSTLLCLVLVANQLALSWFFYLSLFPAAALFIYQQYLIKNRETEKCFTAFKNNHWFGLIIFLGLVGHYLIG